MQSICQLKGNWNGPPDTEKKTQQFIGNVLRMCKVQIISFVYESQELVTWFRAKQVL